MGQEPDAWIDEQFDARLGYGVIFTVGLNTWFLKICVHFS